MLEYTLRRILIALPAIFGVIVVVFAMVRLAPGDPDPDRRAEQWHAVKRAGLDVVMDWDLSPTHHHAVGRDHVEWYTRQTPEQYDDVLRAVKAVLDPAGVMNPGVLFDPA